MKAKFLIQLLVLISIIGLSCQHQKTNPSKKVDPSITFEDNDIKAALTEIEIEGKILKANLEIKNKYGNSISFRFKDFVFTSGEDYGTILNEMYLVRTGPSKIPNYDDLNEVEKELARKEKMESNFKKMIKSSQYWNSELTLESNEIRSKKIELEFKEAIKLDELDFYFGGPYKKLLKL